jgi:hypothetical protein
MKILHLNNEETVLLLDQSGKIKQLDYMFGNFHILLSN